MEKETFHTTGNDLPLTVNHTHTCMYACTHTHTHVLRTLKVDRLVTAKQYWTVALTQATPKILSHSHGENLHDCEIKSVSQPWRKISTVAR